jgi:hypothetical protein
MPTARCAGVPVCRAGPDRGARFSVAAGSRGVIHAVPDHRHARVVLLHGMPGISTNGNPVTALLSRPRIQGGQYSPTAPADAGQHPEHQPPAGSGTHNGG